jgi:hypothetical protein
MLFRVAAILLVDVSVWLMARGVILNANTAIRVFQWLVTQYLIFLTTIQSLLNIKSHFDNHMSKPKN